MDLAKALIGQEVRYPGHMIDHGRQAFTGFEQRTIQITTPVDFELQRVNALIGLPVAFQYISASIRMIQLTAESGLIAITHRDLRISRTRTAAKPVANHYVDITLVPVRQRRHAMYIQEDGTTKFFTHFVQRPFDEPVIGCMAVIHALTDFIPDPFAAPQLSRPIETTRNKSQPAANFPAGFRKLMASDSG